MSVTINIDTDTTDRELAAIACLIAVLRSNDEIPMPPRVLFDYSDNPLAERPAAVAPEPVAAVVPPPPADTPAPPAPASEALLINEAARAAAATPLPGDAPERDINGIPWDERIHAGTKVKNADNSWRTKRGADPALVTSVTAELKAAAATGAGSGEAPPPPIEPGPATVADAATAFGAGGAGGASDAPPPPPADGQSLQEQMAAVAAGAGGAVPPPPPAADDAAPATEALTYPRILDRAGEAGVDYETLNGLAVGFGLAKFMDLPKRPDLFALFMAAMEEHIASVPAA